MNEYRLKPTDICMADAMPWQQHWEARTTWPLAEVLHDKFFLNMRTQLRAGDAITLCRYSGTDPTHRNVKLLEVATLRVIEAGERAEAVPIALIGEISTFGDSPAPSAPLTVARGFAGKFRLMAGEDLVEEFGSKGEADAALAKLAS